MRERHLRSSKFSEVQSEFVHEAINNPGAFRGVKISEHAVNVGDIIQGNRGGIPSTLIMQETMKFIFHKLL